MATWASREKHYLPEICGAVGRSKRRAGRHLYAWLATAIGVVRAGIAALTRRN